MVYVVIDTGWILLMLLLLTSLLLDLGKTFNCFPNTLPKTSYRNRTLVCNKIVDHSDVVGASAVGAAPTTCRRMNYQTPNENFSEIQNKYSDFYIWKYRLQSIHQFVQDPCSSSDQPYFSHIDRFFISPSKGGIPEKHNACLSWSHFT